MAFEFVKGKPYLMPAHFGPADFMARGGYNLVAVNVSAAFVKYQDGVLTRGSQNLRIHEQHAME